MRSRWDAPTRGWRRRVFHYPRQTLMSRNFRLPCAIELQPLSLTPLKMRKVQVRYGEIRVTGSRTWVHFVARLRDLGQEHENNLGPSDQPTLGVRTY